jgi:hypothetical protein
MPALGFLELAPVIFCLSSLFALLGIGGAVIYVPLFYWLGFDLLVAIPMALLLSVVTSGSASVTYLRKKVADVHTALPVMLTAVIGAPVGAHLAGILPEDTLLGLFSLVLAVVGILMVRSKESNTAIHSIPPAKKSILGAVIGFGIGIITGLLGIGGGTFLVPLLLLLGYGVREAPATSMLVVAFSSASAFLAHMGAINFGWFSLFILCLSSFAGSQVGSRLMYTGAFNLDSRIKTHFKHLFGVVLLVIAVLLQYSVY